MKTSTVARGLAALSVAAVGSVAVPAVANASIGNECIVSQYSSNTYRAWCGAAAPGSDFRLVLTCRNASAAYYYAVNGTYRAQGGSNWSYASCNGSDTVFGTSVQVR
ncbi:MAG: hypothetical protein ABIW80_00055 [Lapillicoccus sp.]